MEAHRPRQQAEANSEPPDGGSMDEIVDGMAALTMDGIVAPVVQANSGPSQRMASESELPFVGYEFKRLDNVSW